MNQNQQSQASDEQKGMAGIDTLEELNGITFSLRAIHNKPEAAARMREAISEINSLRRKLAEASEIATLALNRDHSMIVSYLVRKGWATRSGAWWHHGRGDYVKTEELAMLEELECIREISAIKNAKEEG